MSISVFHIDVYLPQKTFFALHRFRKIIIEKNRISLTKSARLLPFNKQHVLGCVQWSISSVINLRPSSLGIPTISAAWAAIYNVCKIDVQIPSLSPDEFTNLSSIRGNLDKLVISRRLGGAFVFCR